jgi:hypothetical protein
MRYRIDDRDLAAFIVYAGRELSLDRSRERILNHEGPFREQYVAGKKANLADVAACRELNKKTLFRVTNRSTLQYGYPAGQKTSSLRIKVWILPKLSLN